MTAVGTAANGVQTVQRVEHRSCEHALSSNSASGVQCISKCAEKFIKHAQRVGVRFGELSSEMEEQLKSQMESAKK